MNFRNMLRRILRISLDAKSLKNGNLDQRIGRRVVRKAVRKSSRKIFK